MILCFMVHGCDAGWVGKREERTKGEGGRMSAEFSSRLFIHDWKRIGRVSQQSYSHTEID
jgi:hypothetical protein